MEVTYKGTPTTAGPDYQRRQLNDLPKQAMEVDERSMNIMHLPPETRFKMRCHDVVSTEDVMGSDGIMRRKIKLNYTGTRTPTVLFDGESTLAGVRFSGYKGTATIPKYGDDRFNIDVRLRHRHSMSAGFRERVTYGLLPNGCRQELLSLFQGMLFKSDGRDGDDSERLAQHMTASSDSYPFIDTASIRFPQKFIDRATVNFAGLPMMTKFMTKSGGTFEIEQRTMLSGSDLVFMIRAVDEASEGVGIEAFHHVENDVFYVRTDLITRNDRKHRVMTETIRCPFIDPLIDAFYGQPGRTTYEIGLGIFPLLDKEGKSVHDECTEYNPMSAHRIRKIGVILDEGIVADDFESFMYG